GATTVSLSAPAAQDAVGVLRYRLQRDGVAVGSWQTSPVFVDSGVTPNTVHSYQIQAADASAAARVSTLTAMVSVRTLAATPAAPLLGTVTQNSAVLLALAPDLNPAGTEYAIYSTTLNSYLAADGTPSAAAVWRTATQWAGVAIAGLTLDKTY